MPNSLQRWLLATLLLSPLSAWSAEPAFLWTTDTQICVMPTRVIPPRNGNAELFDFLSGASAPLANTLLGFAPGPIPNDWYLSKIHSGGNDGLTIGVMLLKPKTTLCAASDLVVLPLMRADSDAYTLSARVRQSGQTREFSRSILVKPEEVPSPAMSKEQREVFAYRVMALMSGLGCDIGQAIGDATKASRCD